MKIEAIFFKKFLDILETKSAVLDQKTFMCYCYGQNTAI